MYLNLKRYINENIKTNQALRMYIVYELFMILLDILGLFQLIQVTYFLDDTIIYQYCSSISYFIYLKKGKYKFHLVGNEVENYYTIPINCNTLNIIVINSSDNI